MNRRHRFAVVTVAALLGTALIAPAASAKPPADKLERARSAVTTGQEKAKGLAKGHAEAPGQENRARGLENAEKAITAAAERKAARDTAKAEGDKPGRAITNCLVLKFGPKKCQKTTKKRAKVHQKYSKNAKKSRKTTRFWAVFYGSTIS